VVEHTIGVSREVHERLISMKSRDSEALEDVMRRLLIMPPRTML
jgi:predicted CopG family antitoxin